MKVRLIYHFLEKSIGFASSLIVYIRVALSLFLNIKYLIFLKQSILKCDVSIILMAVSPVSVYSVILPSAVYSQHLHPEKELLITIAVTVTHPNPRIGLSSHQ